MTKIKESIFKVYPYLEKDDFVKQTRITNYSRSFVISIVIVFISALMYIVSIAVKDLITIQKINLLYFIASSFTCFFFLLLKINKKENFKYKEILLKVIVFINIAWGSSLLAFVPNRYEMYGTYSLILLVISSVLYLNWYVHMLINLGSLAYLFIIYLFIPNIDFFEPPLLPKITVILFLNIFAWVIGRLIYYKNIQNFELNSQLIKKNKEFQFEITQKTNELYEKRESQIHDIILSMSTLLELYTPYTKGHCNNVAVLSKKIAKKLNLSLTEIEDTYWSSLIHDIGKILIPIEILNKPKPLTKEEYDLVKKHPIWGYNALKEAKSLLNISKNVLHHHEWWNGLGYPDGLIGDEIPIISQIISVSDAFDAMTSDRPYRKSLGKEKAIQIIKQNKGKQFSPKVVDSFLDLLAENNFDVVNLLS